MLSINSVSNCFHYSIVRLCSTCNKECVKQETQTRIKGKRDVYLYMVLPVIQRHI